MRKAILFTIILTLTSFLAVLFSQTNCKVLIPAIGDSYTGSCKQGLADGKGEAFGVDQYKGDFKKGLPNGNGTYIWQSGQKYEGSWKNGLRDGGGSYTFKYEGRDSVLTGVWKEDKYIGKKALAPYVVLYLSGIQRVSCIRAGELPYVKYEFSRAGSKAEENDISNLTFQGSTGQESAQPNFVGFEQVTFPFEGKVRFEAPNTLNTATLNCEVRLLINQPGSWTVTIYF
jgi:hypothetical protein